MAVPRMAAPILSSAARALKDWYVPKAIALALLTVPQSLALILVSLAVLQRMDVERHSIAAVAMRIRFVQRVNVSTNPPIVRQKPVKTSVVYVAVWMMVVVSFSIAAIVSMIRFVQKGDASKSLSNVRQKPVLILKNRVAVRTMVAAIHSIVAAAGPTKRAKMVLVSTTVHQRRAQILN